MGMLGENPEPADEDQDGRTPHACTTPVPLNWLRTCWFGNIPGEWLR